MRGLTMDIKNGTHTPKTRPYDDSMLENWLLYDNMPFSRDPALFVDQSFKTVSGNIIKSYRIRLNEPYELKEE